MEKNEHAYRLFLSLMLLGLGLGLMYYFNLLQYSTLNLD